MGALKVLVSTTPGLGHILPLVPLVLEMRAHGHEVRWVGGSGVIDGLDGAGVEVVAAGMPERERMQEFARRHPEVSSIPLRQRQRFTFPRVFAEVSAPQMLGAVQAVADTWAPDVIVHDAAEFAAPLVAAMAEIPSVCHGFGAIVPEAAVRAAGELMAPHWEAAGLAPDPYAGSYRSLYIDIYPPALAGQTITHVPRVQSCRPFDAMPASGTLVYVTFGTLFNQDSDAVRTAVLAAAGVADSVLVTVGHGGDPSTLGPVPGNVRVERFVPQAEVLPHCAVVICHGGSGTVLAALAHGVPVICLPQGADQFINADNITRLGAGTTFDGEDATESTLQDAVNHMLHTTGPSEAAMTLAHEIAAMPDVAHAARAIEELVAS